MSVTTDIKSTIVTMPYEEVPNFFCVDNRILIGYFFEFWNFLTQVAQFYDSKFKNIEALIEIHLLLLVNK